MSMYVLPGYLWEQLASRPLFLVGVIVALLCITLSREHFTWLLRFVGWRKPGQRRRQKAARRVLDKVSSIKQDAKKLAYLRTIDPFVFEELVLEAYERRGLKVKRNQRYTGDGGIDGCVWAKDGTLHLIQAKRYGSYINAQHVRDFIVLVMRKQCQGVFVHTGRTGTLSKRLTEACPNIRMISGKQLLDLITPQQAT